MDRYIEQTRLVPIPGFNHYQISTDGDVLNTKTGRYLIPTPTQAGEPTVGLMQDHIQHRRSVKVLVAEAFVPGKSETFDTPIQLDGNRNNLSANNILWRPRWFAWRYIRQFNDPVPSWYYMGPIYDVINDMQYRFILEAAITTGSLCENIRESVLHEARVFPGGEKYVYM